MISISMNLFFFADSKQTSGGEISRDIIRHVRKAYQSVRVSSKVNAPRMVSKKISGQMLSPTKVSL